MKRISTILLIVTFCMLVSSSAFAIAAGPGGRIYMSARTEHDSSRWIDLKSYEIDANWNVVGYLNSHGEVLDNCWQGDSQDIGKKTIKNISPEVGEYGGQGYGKIVLGAWNNNSPAFTGGGIQPELGQTMDVLSITPGDNTLGFTRLSDGRANLGANNKSTDLGMQAYPDPMGGFTGSADSYLVCRSTSTRGGDYGWIVKDSADAGTDVADTDDDYLHQFDTTATWGGYAWTGRMEGNDREMSGNKFFAGGVRYGGDLSYLARHDNGDYEEWRYWWDWDRNTSPASMLEFGVFTDGGIAAGKTNEGHDAVWVTTATFDNSGSGSWSNYGPIGLFVDLNDDGDAMDNVNGVLEYRQIYFSNSAPNTWDNPSYLWWTDIEFIDGGDNDFLLVRSSNDGLIVLQLTDNGEFAGTGQGANAGDYVHRITSGTTLVSMEFDSELLAQGDIPEPATLLLLGTGVLGAIGVVRRRRMR